MINYLLMFFAVIIWAATFPLGKIILNDMSVSSYIFLRSALSGLISIFAIFFYKNIKITEIKLTFFSALFFILNVIFFSKSLEIIDSSLCSFIASSSIIFVMIIDSFFKKKIPNVKKIISCLVCILGSILMMDNINFQNNYQQAQKGIFYCILATLSFSIGVLIADKISFKSKEPLKNTFLQNIFCFGISSIFIKDGLSTIKILSLSNILIILYVSIFSSIIATTLQFYAQKKISPESTTIIVLSEPIFGAIISYLLLSENIFSLKFIIGGLLILISLFFIVFDNKKINKIKK